MLYCLKQYLVYNKPETIVVALVAIIIIFGLSTNISLAGLLKTFEFVTEALNLHQTLTLSGT